MRLHVRLRLLLLLLLLLLLGVGAGVALGEPASRAPVGAPEAPRLAQSPEDRLANRLHSALWRKTPEPRPGQKPTRETVELCRRSAPDRAEECEGRVTAMCDAVVQLMQRGRGLFRPFDQLTSRDSFATPMHKSDVCALCESVAGVDANECSATLIAEPLEPPGRAYGYMYDLAQRRDVRLAVLIARALHSQGRFVDGADPAVEARAVCGRLTRTNLLDACHSAVETTLRELLGPGPPRAVETERSLDVWGHPVEYRHYEGADCAAEAANVCALPHLHLYVSGCESQMEATLCGEGNGVLMLGIGMVPLDIQYPLLKATQRVEAAAAEEPPHWLTFRGGSHRHDAYPVWFKSETEVAEEAEVAVLCSRTDVRETVPDCEATLTAFKAERIDY